MMPGAAARKSGIWGDAKKKSDEVDGVTDSPSPKLRR